MSIQRVIDGTDALFDFGEFGLPTILASGGSVRSLQVQQLEFADMEQVPVFSPLELGAYAETISTPAELASYLSGTCEIGHYDYRAEDEREDHDEEKDILADYKGKGKAAFSISSPMDIAPARDNVESHFDLFTFSPGSSGSSRGTPSSESSSSTSTTPQSVASFSFSPGFATNVTTPGSYIASPCHISEDLPFIEDDGEEQECVSKGKGKSGACCQQNEQSEQQQVPGAPPSLPPLCFHPTSLADGETAWPADAHASPSYLTLTASSSSSLNSRPVIHSEASPAAAVQQQANSTSHAPPAFLHRVPSRTHSISSLPSMSTRPLSLSKQKLSFGKKKSTSSLARKLLLCNDTPCEGGLEDIVAPKHGVSLLRSKKKAHRPSKSAPVTPTFTPESQHSQFITGQNNEVESDTESSTDFDTENANLSEEVDYFDSLLPREIKLDIFKALLALHELDGLLTCSSPEWTYAKSVNSKYRWIGRSSGYIELVRMSRVSKAWQELVFDGQLWVSLDVSSFPMLPTHLIMRLAQSSGSFVRSVDFTGHTRLSANSFLNLTHSFCISNALVAGELSSSATQLTSIILSGCNAISTHALNDILAHSPLLTHLVLKGLFCVTNSTMETLAAYCPRLITIDISRCRQMDVDGLTVFLSDTRLPLKELRVSGLRRINDALMGLIGKHAPNLEVLDVGGTSLHNSGINAYVSVDEQDDPSRTILLTSREAGRGPSDSKKYRRRVTKLRHLVLSHCVLLTDEACTNLAYSVPHLEFLELAGIGSELKDDGLVRLLLTTPLIRRLDLEENNDLTDAVLYALTPEVHEVQTKGSAASQPPLQPGSRLEQLNMSYALHLTNDALLGLARACTRLRTLELDNTRVNGTVVKEFVQLARKRGVRGAEVVAVDCRGVGEAVMKDLAHAIRTRRGWRGWDARNLGFLDARDEEGLQVATYDECDDARVTLKTFYSWQAVDAVEAAREKKRKANKKAGREASGDEDNAWTRRGTAKWWSPGGRRFSGSISPTTGGDGCIIM